MKLFRLIFLYTISLIVIFIIILSTKNIGNIYLLTAILAIIPAFIYLVYLYFNREHKLLEKTSLRYTMYCKTCGWEWMSNVSDKAPLICPNCKVREKLEIIGWRRVRVSSGKQKEKDLRNFFKI